MNALHERFATLEALWLREWRASSRLARTPLLVAGAAVSLTGFLLLFAGSSSSTPTSDLGRHLFQMCFGVMTGFVILIGPAIAANTIALEREGKTWEALVMSGLTPRAIDRGKFIGAYTHLVVYVLALLPSAGIAHLFGGVAFRETILAAVMVLALGALAVRFGLLLSAIVSSTRAALLVTLCVSAVLSWCVVIVAFVASDFLQSEVGMRSLGSGAPVFWPVGLVYESFGLDYLRYLVVIPVGGVILGWFTLRELTVYALDTTAHDRPHRLTYLAIISGIAVLLGLFPSRASQITLAEILFTAISFAAIVIVAGDRPRDPSATTLRRSLLLFIGGAGGIFVVLGVAALTGPHRTYPDELENLLVYGPAFTFFVIGLTALLRTTCRRTTLGRALTIAVTVAIAIVPMIAAVFVRVAGSSTVCLEAASPLGVLAITAPEDRRPLVYAAVIWAVLGIVSLAVTHRRERPTPSRTRM